MASGNGKIANLPREIRDALNWRINDEVPGTEIVEWVNAIPEVRQVLDELFDGKPISEQNLCEWRKRGYQKWLLRHTILDESRTLSDDDAEIIDSGIDCKKIRRVLTASYAELAQNWNIMPSQELIYKMGVLKNLTNSVLNLQRADVQDTRLEFERERLDLLSQKMQEPNSHVSSSTRAISSANSSPGLPLAESKSGNTSAPTTTPPAPPTPATPTVPSIPSAQPIPSANTPPSPPPSPSRPEPPVTRARSSAPTAATPSPTLVTSDPKPPTPPIPAGGMPRTSTPRNPRGLL